MRTRHAPLKVTGMLGSRDFPAHRVELKKMSAGAARMQGKQLRLMVVAHRQLA
jgi:hypothetical protein